MDRFTIRQGDGVGLSAKDGHNLNSASRINSALIQLAAYEDTGLTPEEASALKKSNQHNLDCYVAEHDDNKALRAENAQLRRELEAAKQREQFLTESYDRQATIHEALTRDYLAAQRDVKRMLQDTDIDGFCVYCQHLYREACDGCEDAEWRGPQEGANE